MSRTSFSSSTHRVGAVALAASLGASGCFFGADGREPPQDELVFPTAVVASPGGTALYVANSDFDLQYSGGTVMALDLRRLREVTTPIVTTLAAGEGQVAACASASVTVNRTAWLTPGPCEPLLVAPFVSQVASVGAFTSGLLLLHEPNGSHARLFAPVRGDPSITYFEVADDRAVAPGDAIDLMLDCGQIGGDFCAAANRLGQDPDRNLRGVQLPADPVGIAATSKGDAIVAAHQTQGAASLIVNPWDGRPELTYFSTGLSTGPTELASIPEPAFVATAEASSSSAAPFVYRRGFALTFIGTSALDVLRFVPDSGSVPPRPFIQREASVVIATNASAIDSRGIAIDDRARRACEAGCSALPEPLACQVACAEEVPLHIFMANRSPASLLLGEARVRVNRGVEGDPDRLTSATEEILFYDSIPLSFGPSRVEIGQVVDAQGELAARVFAVAFDTRSVFIIDPDAARVEAVVRTGRGPQDVAVDVGHDAAGEAYAFLYVAHFTDSYLGVVDLDLRRPSTYGQMFASIGIPKDPEDSN
ncbi:MAG: hypothetical protein R3B72_25720 [Polyangiaceae bacterium]